MSPNSPPKLGGVPRRERECVSASRFETFEIEKINDNPHEDSVERSDRRKTSAIEKLYGV